MLATISDKKIGVASLSNSSLIDHYTADVRSAQDYYPFGSIMSGRSFNTSKARYGFNGQEMSNEIKGEGNTYTAQFWEYDSRIGRRWNLDPKPMSGVSEYSAFNNNPIWFSDLLGDTIRNYDIARVSGKGFSPRQGATLSTVNGVGKAGNYTLNAVYETSEGGDMMSRKLVGYEAMRDGRTEWQLDKGDIKEFRAASAAHEFIANITYGAGMPTDDQFRYVAGVSKGNTKLAQQGLQGMWKDASTNPLWWTGMISGTLASVRTGKPALRLAYESETRGIVNTVKEMRSAGASSEEIARTVHGMRRELGIKYKDLTPADKLEIIYKRNIKLYEDKLGPSIDWLRAHKKSWEDIIESATRPGGKDLNF